MNLKDYQRGRNDGLALALKIVQEGGREALEAEIKNRGVTGGELIMNYNESKETVLQLLPAEEVILQFAEECVELSREILVFDVEADGRLLSNGTEYKMLSKVREEAADVELDSAWEDDSAPAAEEPVEETPGEPEAPGGPGKAAGFVGERRSRKVSELSPFRRKRGIRRRR